MVLCSVMNRHNQPILTPSNHEGTGSTSANASSTEWLNSEENLDLQQLVDAGAYRAWEMPEEHICTSFL